MIYRVGGSFTYNNPSELSLYWLGWVSVSFCWVSTILLAVSLYTTQDQSPWYSVGKFTILWLWVHWFWGRYEVFCKDIEYFKSLPQLVHPEPENFHTPRRISGALVLCKPLIRAIRNWLICMAMGDRLPKGMLITTLVVESFPGGVHTWGNVCFPSI